MADRPETVNLRVEISPEWLFVIRRILRANGQPEATLEDAAEALSAAIDPDQAKGTE